MFQGWHQASLQCACYSGLGWTIRSCVNCRGCEAMYVCMYIYIYIYIYIYVWH